MKLARKMRPLRLALMGLSLGLMFIANTAHAGKTLSGDEVKSLITGKTVHFVSAKGDRWRAYFSADGKVVSDDAAKEETWYVDEQGRHCNTGLRFLCAEIENNGDGTFSRMNPSGGVAANLIKIESGKTF